jgi:hypothetical protein
MVVLFHHHHPAVAESSADLVLSARLHDAERARDAFAKQVAEQARELRELRTNCAQGGDALIPGLNRSTLPWIPTGVPGLSLGSTGSRRRNKASPQLSGYSDLVATLSGFSADRNITTGRSLLQSDTDLNTLDVGGSLPPRRLVEGLDVEGCSKTEVLKLLEHPDRDSQLEIMRDLFTDNVNCGVCILECASGPHALYPDILRCLFGCQHQRENRCSVSLVGTEAATLEQRSSLLSIMELVEADCMYCILESVESVCGSGCKL